MATVDSGPESPPIYHEGGQETSYVFVKGLGAGAFAEANLYRKIDDNSLVVWKEINMARLGEKEQRDAINEIDILCLLNHANIITYYNHFMDGDTLLIELEYANGGTLAQKIDKQKEPFDENVVKWYLYQLASALAHCHEHGIIHRDVKCLNIFMTKTDLLKLGDFGISKMLESKSQLAETVAGTPLYMSPELMKGDKYDYKTDIWALGCVVNELLTLAKTFQGTNHLRLAYEIVCGEHSPIDSRYSKEIRDLVDRMLQKDPTQRPSSQEIVDHEILSNAEVLERRVYGLNTVARRIRIQSSVSVNEQTIVPVVKSKVTEVYQWGGGKLVPQKQDIFVKGKSAFRVSTGHSHFAVVTVEKEVFTWANIQGGDKIVGQLGHDNTAAYKMPKKVEALEGVGIIQAECGEDFTIFLSDEGQLHSCGSDFFGCLGCNGEEGDEVTSPIHLNFFSDHFVKEVSCGTNHVLALTNNLDVYSWGCGEFGRLGLGSEDDYASPQKVVTTKKHMIQHVLAGVDGSFLLTTTGRILACGSNENNKLGFNSEMSGLKKHKPKVYDIPCTYTFSLVRPLIKLNVITIATGATHSAVIDICGHLHTFGSNRYGQLGLGDFKKRDHVCLVQGVLAGHRVERVACGDTFTLAATSDNQLYCWGNGENGRLGCVSPDKLDLGKGPNGKSSSIPRPIFGSLHVIPHLSARHWHTVVIAEKVLNQKTLKTRASMPKMKLHSEKKVVFKDSQPIANRVNLSNVMETSQKAPGEDSAFGDQSDSQTGDFDPSLTGDSGKPVSPDGSQPTSLSPNVLPAMTEDTAEEELPPWLQAELQEDPIPMPLNFMASPNTDIPLVTAEGFQWLPNPGPAPIVPPLNFNSSQSLTESTSSTVTINTCLGGHVPKDNKDSIIEGLMAKIAELEKENKQLRDMEETQLSMMRIRLAQLEAENKQLKSLQPSLEK